MRYLATVPRTAAEAGPALLDDAELCAGLFFVPEMPCGAREQTPETDVRALVARCGLANRVAPTAEYLACFDDICHEDVFCHVCEALVLAIGARVRSDAGDDHARLVLTDNAGSPAALARDKGWLLVQTNGRSEQDRRRATAVVSALVSLVLHGDVYRAREICAFLLSRHFALLPTDAPVTPAGALFDALAPLPTLFLTLLDAVSPTLGSQPPEVLGPVERAVPDAYCEQAAAVGVRQRKTEVPREALLAADVCGCGVSWVTVARPQQGALRMCAARVFYPDVGCGLSVVVVEGGEEETKKKRKETRMLV